MRLNGIEREVRQMVIDNAGVVEVEKGLKIIPGASTIVGTLDKIVNWGRLSSIWPMAFGLA